MIGDALNDVLHRVDNLEGEKRKRLTPRIRNRLLRSIDEETMHQVQIATEMPSPSRKLTTFFSHFVAGIFDELAENTQEDEILNLCL